MEKAVTERRFLTHPISLEQRADGEESRTISGYALKFNTESTPIWGCFIETIRSGALDGCDMTDVIACFNHNPNSIMARSTSKTLSLTADEVGLRFAFDAPNTTAGNDLLELVRRGDITTCSFAFQVAEDRWTFTDDDELDRREVLKIAKISDISPVVYAAYEDTEVTAERSRYNEQRSRFEADHRPAPESDKASMEPFDMDLQILKLKNQ